MKTHTCIAVYDGPMRTEHAVKELLSADFEESQIIVIGRRLTW